MSSLPSIKEISTSVSTKLSSAVGSVFEGGRKVIFFIILLIVLGALIFMRLYFMYKTVAKARDIMNYPKTNMYYLYEGMIIGSIVCTLLLFYPINNEEYSFFHAFALLGVLILYPASVYYEATMLSDIEKKFTYEKIFREYTCVKKNKIIQDDSLIS